jgi:predicted CXXCH cytochrome family protein
LLKGDPIAFCQSCHINIKKGRSHPMGENIRDPLKKRPLTCASTCHNVHRSDFPNLISWEHRVLCTKCHTDKLR